MKPFVVLTALSVLVACGGGGARFARDAAPAGVRVSSGPIASACLAANRRAANPTLCGCIQTAANQSLSQADQRRAVPFFADPERAQDVRKSDTTRNDAFWDRYLAFADRAEQVCGGL